MIYVDLPKKHCSPVLVSFADYKLLDFSDIMVSSPHPLFCVLKYVANAMQRAEDFVFKRAVVIIVLSLVLKKWKRLFLFLLYSWRIWQFGGLPWHPKFLLAWYGDFEPNYPTQYFRSISNQFLFYGWYVYTIINIIVFFSCSPAGINSVAKMVIGEEVCWSTPDASDIITFCHCRN